MIDIIEFRKKTKEELKKELENLSVEFRKVISDILQKKEKNVRKAGLLKKDIARIKTLLNEKRLEINNVVKEENKAEVNIKKEKKEKKNKKVNLEKEEK